MVATGIFSFSHIFHEHFLALPHGLVGIRVDNRRSLVRSLTQPILFPVIDDSHCNRIHSTLIFVRNFDNGYVGKQPLAWKEYCAEYRLKELQESMDRWIGRRNNV